MRARAVISAFFFITTASSGGGSSFILIEYDWKPLKFDSEFVIYKYSNDEIRWQNIKTGLLMKSMFELTFSITLKSKFVASVSSSDFAIIVHECRWIPVGSIVTVEMFETNSMIQWKCIDLMRTFVRFSRTNQSESIGWSNPKHCHYLFSDMLIVCFCIQ